MSHCIILSYLEWLRIHSTVCMFLELAKESLGHYELRCDKPWFGECLELLVRRKQDKLQQSQNSNQKTEANLDNVVCEGSRTSRTKKRGS